jgi:hypothetical protein
MSRTMNSRINGFTRQLQIGSDQKRLTKYNPLYVSSSKLRPAVHPALKAKLAGD